MQASLQDRVLIYFGRHPEEELTTADVATKFGVRFDSVNFRLSRLVRDELLCKGTWRPKQSKLMVYRPGPELLKLVGLAWAAEACRPVVCGNVAVA